MNDAGIENLQDSLQCICPLLCYAQPLGFNQGLRVINL